MMDNPQLDFSVLSITSQRQQVQEVNSPAPPGGSQGIHRPERIHNPSSEFRVCPGLSSQWDVQGKPPEGGAQEAS